MTCMSSEDGTRCSVHGGKYSQLTGQCQTLDVLAEVSAERAQQFDQYSTNENLEDGTGPNAVWVSPITYWSASHIEKMFREDYETYEALTGAPTWMHLVREEVAEAFAETDQERLRAELIQLAALCVSWVEKMDTRPKPTTK